MKKLARSAALFLFRALLVFPLAYTACVPAIDVTGTPFWGALNRVAVFGLMASLIAGISLLAVDTYCAVPADHHGSAI